MNKKLVNEFSKKLKTLDENLAFEVLENAKTDLDGGFVKITEKGTVLIKYNDRTVLKLRMDSSMPAIYINRPILLYKDSSVFFSDLIKLCGEYLDAFFGDDDE